MNNTSNKKNEFWFLNWNNFCHGNDHAMAMDRVNLVSGRRVKTRRNNLAIDITIVLFLFFTILFCYLLLVDWDNNPHDSSSSAKKLGYPTSSKPLPPPPPPADPSSLTHTSQTKHPDDSSSSAEKLSYPTSSKSLPPPPPPTYPSSLTLISQPKQKQYPLQCTTKSPNNQTCPYNNYPTNVTITEPDPPKTCPEYFRWIHEDLKPWKETGITRQMVEGARKTAHFRLVIVNGKMYVEKFRKSLQTRDDFTIWGFLQLLRWYPGKLPDLELMFDCDDRPVIPASRFRRPNSNPPALFRYCSDDFGLDIVFPDWSFWGWAETNIKPWRNTSRDIQEGNMRIKWEDRVPYAYWRGNPNVHSKRQDLLKCNVSNDIDWNARLYVQNWKMQKKEGYKESNLEDQCTHRYKIYIEGWAWSVSQKYILGCDSMTLLVKPDYYEFYTRGMLPLVHYWPIRDNQKCKSLKFAVEWGNNHTSKAKAIGEAGSKYIHEDLKLENVYDYMFHLLSEYAKLLRFKPVIPPNATELCPEAMACQAQGIWRKLMEDSLEKSPKDGSPCTLPPPYEPLGLNALLDMKANLTRQLEMWEDNYWAVSSRQHMNKL